MKPVTPSVILQIIDAAAILLRQAYQVARASLPSEVFDHLPLLVVDPARENRHQ